MAVCLPRVARELRFHGHGGKSMEPTLRSPAPHANDAAEVAGPRHAQVEWRKGMGLLRNVASELPAWSRQYAYGRGEGGRSTVPTVSATPFYSERTGRERR